MVGQNSSLFQITPLGCDPVTEGCGYWLETSQGSLLLDCGFEPLERLPHAPDWVLISHAHLDHVRGLPELHRRYPDVPILATPATYHLAQHLGLEGIPPMRCIPLGRAVPLSADLTVCLFEAGHLPGAAAAVLRWTDGDPARTVVYTGDCSLSATRFAEGLNLEALRQWQPDVVLLEGSLGIDRYPSRRHQESRLLDTITTALEHGSLVLIPVPAIGLGQDLAFMLKTHHQFTRPELNLTVWLDKEVSQGCEAYGDLISGFPSSVKNFAQFQELFWEERVFPHVRPLFTDGVFTDGVFSDVATPWEGAGILLCDTQRQDWQPIWRLLRASGRLLSWIQIPEVVPQIRLDRWPLDLRERLEVFSTRWHSHCDSSTLVQIAHTLRPQHLVFVNGDPEHRLDLATLPELSARYHVHAPMVGHPLELTRSRLDLPPPPDLRYEAHVEEGSGSRIQITLPGQITRDPRWTEWADTGMLEARWQGSELVLRGLSAREVLRLGEEERVRLDWSDSDQPQTWPPRWTDQGEDPISLG